jgi:hypothetical protein
MILEYLRSCSAFGGYAWGLEIKAELLRREGAVGGGLLL